MPTPRERLITALNHREPDRVPIDLGGNQTGIHRIAYEKLLDYLGLPVPDWMEGSSLLQPVDPARIILAGGTRKASRQDNNLFSLSAASVKPPFYQFSYLTAVQCSRWHSINLDQLNMKSDWVSSAVDPCPGSQPAAPEQIREQVGGWLRDRGYDLPAGW